MQRDFETLVLCLPIKLSSFSSVSDASCLSTEKIDISFVGISSETVVFEHLSIDILSQSEMCNKGNDLRNVLIHDQREIRRERDSS